MRITLQVNPQEWLAAEKVWFMASSEKLTHEFLKVMCEKVKERIKEVVVKQSYSWSPLSESWKEQKRLLGLSPKVWYASGEVIDAITYWYHRPTKSFYIGVNPKKKHHAYRYGGIYRSKKTDVLLIDIIRKLEYGTQRIPPRPLLTRVLEEFRPTLRHEFISYVVGTKMKSKATTKLSKQFKINRR